MFTISKAVLIALVIGFIGIDLSKQEFKLKKFKKMDIFVGKMGPIEFKTSKKRK